MCMCDLSNIVKIKRTAADDKKRSIGVFNSYIYIHIYIYIYIYIYINFEKKYSERDEE